MMARLITVGLFLFQQEPHDQIMPVPMRVVFGLPLPRCTPVIISLVLEKKIGLAKQREVIDKLERLLGAVDKQPPETK